MGGDTATGFVEQYNGTSWITQAYMANARGRAAGNGTSPSSILAFQGANPGNGYQTATEEYNPETTALNFKTITTS